LFGLSTGVLSETSLCAILLSAYAFCSAARLQELCSLRQQNKQLQEQASEATSAAQHASSRAASLTADNHKLQEALAHARNDRDQRVEEVARLLTEAAQLKSDVLRLDSQRQEAAGNAAQWEHKYKTQEQVGIWHCRLTMLLNVPDACKHLNTYV
jgi:sensor c-di-GMP phosphodiesterase-like protein